MTNNKVGAPRFEFTSLEDILPENARRYYRKPTAEFSIANVKHKSSASRKAIRALGLGLLYPVCNLTYLAANEVLVALENGEYRIFGGPGLRWVVGPNDRILGKYTIGEDIDVGPIKLVYVPAGMLKYVMDLRTSEPMLLGPGTHFFNDLNIKTTRGNNLISMNSGGKSTLVQFGDSNCFSFIFVRTGECAVICTRTGDIKVLNPGLHFIEAPDTFRTFVSVQQEHLTFGSSGPGNPSFLTADNVALSIDATMFYRVSDVHTAFTTSISTIADLVETLRSQAMSTLMAIIRSANFSQITRKTMEEDKVGTDAKGKQPLAPAAAPSAPPASDVAMGFQNIMHDAEPQFKATMMERFGDTYGFAIESLRIERIEYNDKNLQKQVSEFAVTFARLSAQEAQIAAERKVELAQAEREAAKLQIKANADNERMMRSVQADSEAKGIAALNSAKLVRIAAEAEAEALRIKGQAEADVVSMKAAADAKAILAVGEAEADVLGRKGAHPNAALAMLVDGQVRALNGVEKVVYCNTDSQVLLQTVSQALTQNITGKK